MQENPVLFILCLGPQLLAGSLTDAQEIRSEERGSHAEEPRVLVGCQ